VAIEGEENSQIVVVGDNIDSVNLTYLLRKKVGFAECRGSFFFFGPRLTKSKTPEICQRPKTYQAQWSTVAKNIKRKWLSAINQIQSPKKRNPAHSIHKLMSAKEAPEGSK
jgi:hypothetical protein